MLWLAIFCTFVPLHFETISYPPNISCFLAFCSRRKVRFSRTADYPCDGDIHQAEQE